MKNTIYNLSEKISNLIYYMKPENGNKLKQVATLENVFNAVVSDYYQGKNDSEKLLSDLLDLALQMPPSKTSQEAYNYNKNSEQLLSDLLTQTSKTSQPESDLPPKKRWKQDFEKDGKESKKEIGK